MEKQEIINGLMAQIGIKNLEATTEEITLQRGQEFSKKYYGVAVAVHGLNNSGDRIEVNNIIDSISHESSFFSVSDETKKGTKELKCKQMIVRTFKSVMNTECKFLVITFKFKKP